MGLCAGKRNTEKETTAATSAPHPWDQLTIGTENHSVYMSSKFEPQSTYIYRVSQCPLVGIGTLPPPLSPASVPLTPEPLGGGGGTPAGDWLGEFQFRRLEKSLALCLSVVRTNSLLCEGRFSIILLT
jgi:hypothetical protein